eukprot:1156760-Pelagomonas_calceolata.AAC.3
MARWWWQPQLFKLIKGMLNITLQAMPRRMVQRVTTFALEKYFALNEPAEVCMLPRVFTILDFNQVLMSLVCIQLVRLSHAVGYAGSLCGPVPAA